MADTKTPAERSENMSHIRSTNTKPEEIVRKYLFSHGFRYRKNDKRYPGKPDIVLPKYRTIIFVNGCFWHRCPHCALPLPKSNVDFWQAKFARNVARDERDLRLLSADGWTVLVVWECALKGDAFDSTMSSLVREVRRAEDLGPALGGRVVEVGSAAPWKLRVSRTRARGRARR